MVLTKEQIDMARITYTQVVEDSFVLDLLDTIADKDVQITHLQAQLEAAKVVMKQAKEALVMAWSESELDWQVAQEAGMEAIKALEAMEGGE